MMDDGQILIPQVNEPKNEMTQNEAKQKEWNHEESGRRHNKKDSMNDFEH